MSLRRSPQRPAFFSARRLSLRWSAAVLLALSVACGPMPATDEAPPVADEKPLIDVDARTFNAVPHQVLVKGVAAAQAAAASVGGDVELGRREGGWHLVSLPGDLSVLGGMQQLADEGIAAEPNYIYRPTLTEPPDFGQQWAMDNDGAFTLNGVPAVADVDMNAPEAWGTNETPGAGGVLGMIDAGINLTHPALAGRLWTNAGESATPDGVDTDMNGYIDDRHGWATGGITLDNGQDHGTSVGTMMVGYGQVTGVAPGAELVSCVPFQPGGFGNPALFFTSQAIVACLEYFLELRQAGVNILAVNNSYGGLAPDEALKQAIEDHRDAGILFVASSGNDGYDNDERPRFPSAYDVANVISVGAIDHRGELPAFAAGKSSNVGAHSVDLMAPGFAIRTAEGPSGYDFVSGTSVAAPMVTGAVALVHEADPTLDMVEIRNLIVSSGRPVPGAAQSVSGRMLRLSDPGSGGALDCASAPVSGRLTPTTNAVFYTQPGQPVTLRYLAVDCEASATTSVNVFAPNATVVLLDSGAGVDELAGDGIFSGTYAPPVGGDHALLFPDGDELIVHAGPVIREAEVVPHAPETLSSPTEITALTGQLDAVATISLPFPVAFNGTTYSQVSISTHGTAVLGSSSFGAYFNTDLGEASLPDALFAPYWDDLDLRDPGASGDAGKVLTQTLGTGSDRRFVIEWHEARHYSTGGEPVTVQLVFHEDGSGFTFHYVDTDHATPAWDFGASATVGIRGHDYYQLQYSVNQAIVPDATSLFFEAVAPWQNPANPYDTTDDQMVSARDALVVINWLSRNPAGPVPDLSVQQPPFYYDVSGDNKITALDALRVINELGRMDAAGEPLSVVDTQRPWQEHEDGILYTGLSWNYAMGYHFTPEVDGTIDSLGAFVTGTKTIKLFEKDTGSLLASTTVTGNNDWAWDSVPLTDVAAGTTYTVAVYLAGSGGSYRYLSGDELFPRSHGGVTIEGSTYAYTASDPDARPTNTITSRMYGQADVGFIPDENVALPQ